MSISIEWIKRMCVCALCQKIKIVNRWNEQKAHGLTRNCGVHFRFAWFSYRIFIFISGTHVICNVCAAHQPLLLFDFICYCHCCAMTVATGASANFYRCHYSIAFTDFIYSFNRAVSHPVQWMWLVLTWNGLAWLRLAYVARSTMERSAIIDLTAIIYFWYYYNNINSSACSGAFCFCVDVFVPSHILSFPNFVIEYIFVCDINGTWSQFSWFVSIQNVYI